MIEGAIYLDGKIILRYDQPTPKLVKSGNKQYYFDCKYGVSLGFVDESDVPDLLAVRGGCCGKNKLIISLASQVSYSHWLDGLGGR